MEAIFDVIKGLNHQYKIAIGLLLFLCWSLSISFIYLYNSSLFINTDIVKLTLFSAAFTIPFIFINCLFLYPVLKSLNSRRAHDAPVNEAVASALLGSVILTSFLIGIVDLNAFFQNSNKNISILLFSLFELFLIGLLCIKIYKKRD